MKCKVWPTGGPHRLECVKLEFISLRSIENNDQLKFENDLPINSLFFSITGSTYRRQQMNINSDRFHVCITTPVLEHLHEVNLISFLY